MYNTIINFKNYCMFSFHFILSIQYWCIFLIKFPTIISNRNSPNILQISY